MIDFDLDDENATADKIEQFQKTGGLVPEGKYHVRLDGWKPTSAQSGLTGEELHYVIASGPFEGAEITDTLWNSDKDGAKRRAMLFGHRLGLLVRNGAKFKKAPGKESFADCIGAECVVEVKHEEYVNKKGKKGIALRITFNGVWGVDDPSVKSLVKAAPAKSPGAKPDEPAKAPKKKVDTSEL